MMTITEVYQLAIDHGAVGTQALIATAIAMAESSLNPDAIGDTNLETNVWGPSVGLWQIRSLKAQAGTGQARDATRLTDPGFNAASAAAISKGWKDWIAWSTYTNGAYKKNLNEVQAALPQAKILDGPGAIPASPAASRPVLRQGERGTWVQALQSALASKLFPPGNSGGPIHWDGIFGPATRQAVEAFQGSRGIAVDGIVGPVTWGKLLST